MSDYYILSLRWTRSGEEMLTWWGPKNSGYVLSLDNAGKYSADTVAAARSYYDNRETTIAIPCEVADKHSSRVLHHDASHVMLTEALGIDAAITAPFEDQLDDEGKPYECRECEQRPQHKGQSKLIIRAKSGAA